MSNSAQSIADQNYQVKIGDYFGRGWDLFKQNALLFVGFFLLVVLFNVLATSLPFPIGTSSKGQPGLGSLATFVLNPILSAGLVIVAFKTAKSQKVSFSDFFLGFNNFLQIFLVNIVGGLLTAIGLVLLIIPGIYLGVAYTFATSLVIEKRFDFWTALETSRKLITKQWFSFFILVILIGLLNFGGALLLGIGLLITAPYSVCVLAAAYEDIVGLNRSITDSGAF